MGRGLRQFIGLGADVARREPRRVRAAEVAGEISGTLDQAEYDKLLARARAEVPQLREQAAEGLDRLRRLAE